MSLIDNLIAMRPNLAMPTLKNYVDKLHIIKDYKEKKDGKSIDRGELTMKDLELIADIDLVEELIKDKKELTQKNYYLSYSVLLQTDSKNYQAEIDYYTKKARFIQEKYETETNKQQKTPSQAANWVSIKELQKILENQFEIIEKMNLKDKPTIKKAEYKLVQAWFIGSLYVADPIDHPPVRVDYAPMDIIQKDIYDKIEADSIEEKQNYLVVEGQKPLQFHFGDYKTFRTYGVQINKISKIMKPIIEFYLNIHNKFTDDNSLLLNRMFKPLSENGLTKAIPTIFKSTGKNITITLLRHIVISEVVPARNKREKDTAKKMLHSRKMQSNYSKVV